MARSIFAGLDTGVEKTSVCVVDDLGCVLRRGCCPSNVPALHQELKWLKRRRSAIVALEAGSTAIARGLRSLGYHVDIFETRQLSKFLKVRRNKTDANDARGIADACRVGRQSLARVHLKSLESQALQSRLVFRRRIIRERIAAVNLLCRQIELYGGRISKSDALANLTPRALAEIRKIFRRTASPIVEDLKALLLTCERLKQEQSFYDTELRAAAFADADCRRFMTIPGVGPICALTFKAAIDDPERFPRAHNVGSYLGLAPRLLESGLTSRRPRISKMGNSATRALLVRAAITFMRGKSSGHSLGRWTADVERRSGKLRSRVALARRIAVIMLAMWKSGHIYRPSFNPPDQPTSQV